jgi:hypothetical protein
MIDPQELFLSEEQLREFAARRRDGDRKPERKKKSRAQFIQVPLAICHKLVDEKANRFIWAMVCALSETWFTTGRHNQHLNPFPLDRCAAEKWGLTRLQKFRALKFLTRIRLIAVNRRNPKTSLVTLTWVPRYPARSVSPMKRCVSPMKRFPS